MAKDIRDFRNQLKDYLKNFCDENGKNLDNESDRGHAFENFCFELFCQRYQYSDDLSEDECIFRTNDRQFDIIIPADGYDTWTVIQCECVGTGTGSKSRAPTRDKADTFFKRFHDLTNNKNWVKETVTNKDLSLQLYELNEAIKKRDKVFWVYCTNGTETENMKNDLKVFKKSILSTMYPEVTFDIIDVEGLASIYNENQQIDNKIPDDIKIQTKVGHTIYSTDGDFNYLICLIPANEIIQTTLHIKENIFDENIRTNLGRKGNINVLMRETLSNDPGKFRHYNNGISAVCERIDYDEQTRIVNFKKFYVINGAQTLASLWDERDRPNIRNAEVILRVTEIKSKSTVLSSITRFNNSQNKVNAPDFRSNDNVQKDLEKKFNDQKSNKIYPNYIYRRKRPYSSASNKIRITIEEFAKIRAAYRIGSAAYSSTPHKLWAFSTEEPSGWYDTVFSEKNYFTDKEFNEFIFVYTVYLRVSEDLDEFSKLDKDNERNFKFIKRFRTVSAEAIQSIISDDTIYNENERNEIYNKSDNYNDFLERFLDTFTKELKGYYKEKFWYNSDSDADRASPYNIVRNKDEMALLIDRTKSNFKMMLSYVKK